ncbi:MAG TPA: DUF892 family protein [Chryseolinea sp.]|nr:DUF892 family protein [Chryseolinea sp.]
MISQFNEECLQIDPSLEKSPAHLVLSDTLRELYGSKNRLMRTLLRLENTAVNGRLQRTIHDYFEATRIQVYSIEHVFELLDENPEGRMCAMTEMSCRNALAMLNNPDKIEGTDKRIRSSVAEFFAQEITSLEYLLRLALSMERLDIARVISDMQRRTRDNFEFAFPATRAHIAA